MAIRKVERIDVPSSEQRIMIRKDLDDAYKSNIGLFEFVGDEYDYEHLREKVKDEATRYVAKIVRRKYLDEKKKYTGENKIFLDYFNGFCQSLFSITSKKDKELGRRRIYFEFYMDNWEHSVEYYMESLLKRQKERERERTKRNG